MSLAPIKEEVAFNRQTAKTNHGIFTALNLTGFVLEDLVSESSQHLLFDPDVGGRTGPKVWCWTQP
jgi:hypothetical protein